MDNKSFKSLEMADQLDYLNKAMNNAPSKKFVIPYKNSNKPNTRAFNVVMTDMLVQRLDKLGKGKGYSRNEIINKMCQFAIDNME